MHMNLFPKFVRGNLMRDYPGLNYRPAVFLFLFSKNGTIIQSINNAIMKR